MLKSTLEGLKVVVSVKMAGEIKITPFPTKEGRLTGLTITAEHVLDEEKRETTNALLKTIEVVCGPVTDEAVKAEHEKFKEELPGIIEASKKFREELEKKEAEKEGEEEEEEEEEEGEEGEGEAEEGGG